MKNAKNNANAIRPETMAQKHARLYRELPLIDFIDEVLADWQSGDMALSRMEMVVTSELEFLTRVKGYKKFFGKMERIGRLGKGNGWNPSMGKVTPNEIDAYFVRCIEFAREIGGDNKTAQEIAHEAFWANA
jgi:hypothetical protein